MIERLLAADAALERGDLGTAERLFGSVAEADPRNAIAAVGMGRVAAGRDDAEGARSWFLRALEIDPQEAAARRLLTALERELAAMAGQPAPAATPVEPPMPRPAPDRRPVDAAPSVAAPAPVAAPPVAAAAPAATAAPVATQRRSLLDRIRAWFGLAARR